MHHIKTQIRETLSLKDEIPLIRFSAEKGEGREELLSYILKVAE